MNDYKPSPEAAAIIEASKASDGRIRVRWTSSVKPAAAHKDKVLTKTTTGVVQIGLNYSDLPEVRAKRAASPPATDDGAEKLAWGEWALHPYILVHKGVEYLRMYPVQDEPLVPSYNIDGHPATKEAFNALLTPSQQAEKDSPVCFNKKIAEIEFLALSSKESDR